MRIICATLKGGATAPIVVLGALVTDPILAQDNRELVIFEPVLCQRDSDGGMSYYSDPSMMGSIHFNKDIVLHWGLASEESVARYKEALKVLEKSRKMAAEEEQLKKDEQDSE